LCQCRASIQPMSDARETLRFGDFELDLAAYALRRQGHP
jgi:hypothetical protein